MMQDLIIHFLNWKVLSKNKNISKKFILNYIDQPWDFDHLSANPNVTQELVGYFPDKPWNWLILYNINENEFLLEFCVRNISNLDALYKNDATQYYVQLGLARRINVIKWEFIEYFHDYNWNWGVFSKCQNISWDFVKSHLDKNWNWDDILNNVPLEIVIENPNLPWNWRYVTAKILDWDVVKENSNLPWDWSLLNSRDDIDKDVIESFPDGQWDWDNLSRPDYLQYEILFHFQDKPWNWKELSKSVPEIIPFEFLATHLDKPWDDEILWDRASYYTDIPLAFLVAHRDKPWNWEMICRNALF